MSSTMMDLSFLDHVHVPPGEEEDVLYLMEVATTQIATALIASKPPNDDACDVPSSLKVLQDSNRLRAYQTCLEVIHRAMTNTTTNPSARAHPSNKPVLEQALPPTLVASLVQHPLLNHILILMEYTHLRLTERAKRRVWLQQVSAELSPTTTEFAVEAMWSLLTAATTPSSNPVNNKNDNNHSGSNTTHHEKLHLLAAMAGSESPLPELNKANAQSPMTVEDHPTDSEEPSNDKDHPLVSPDTGAASKYKLPSPLLSVPVVMTPKTIQRVAESHSETLSSLPPLMTVPPTSPRAVLPPLPSPMNATAASISSWTLAGKKSHQATRLFRLHHAAECTNPACTLPSCAAMKHVLGCCSTTISNHPANSSNCPLPFCFGAKCALLHFQSCGQPEKCRICSDYWERVACQQVVKEHEQQQQQQQQQQHRTKTSRATTNRAKATLKPPPPSPPPPPQQQPSQLKDFVSSLEEPPNKKHRRLPSSECENVAWI